MNALPSTMIKCLGLGVGLWAAVDCSAEASSPAPQPQGTHTTSGSGGSGGTGSNLPLAGSIATGTAGTPTTTGTAGMTATGTAGMTSTGTAGTPSTGTAGAPGAGGGGALAACPAPPAAGAIADLLIDDLEDKDNGVARVGNRTGYWYTYLDAFGSTITPKPDATGTAPLLPGSTMCHGGMACIMISGTTAAADEVAKKYPYAGVGFDFSNAKKPCIYNASAYTGIKFWARGDVPITIKLNTSATAKMDGGGTCTGDLCNGGFSPAGADVVLTAAWQQIDINFATAAPPAWAAALAMHPDKANLVSLQVQVPPGQTFSIALDDFTFY